MPDVSVADDDNPFASARGTLVFGLLLLLAACWFHHVFGELASGRLESVRVWWGIALMHKLLGPTLTVGVIGLAGAAAIWSGLRRLGEPSAPDEGLADESRPALTGTGAARVAPRRPASSPDAERRRIELTRTNAREPARGPLSTRFTGRGRETDLREQLRFAAARCEFDAAGLQASFGGGALRALPWSQLAEVRARTLPSDPPWESALIVDFVPAAAEGRTTEPIRLLPATTMHFRDLPGGAASSRKENLRRLVGFALAQNPAAAVEPASAGFFREGKDSPRFASMAQFNEYDAGYD